ncbi:SLC13 family permease [Mesonia maritima]|uniref:Sodium-dependent dicarboxylate transporter 2/3/5 n=1 Tax=Mesonia maritima TaxID=1793873 RepID=A0ABU1K8X9_9FLAO|nr:SLC13 family permease [Mesonia maritima]MDR6302055.1 sodium-dependent dicarboxylate transporter 2/3/5 [Mesonia maritima]
MSNSFKNFFLKVSEKPAIIKIIFRLLGPLAFVVFHFQVLEKPEALSNEAFSVLGLTIWMAIWWVTEVVPIAVTALLPMVIFPLSGVLALGETTKLYGHKYVFLYVGGFILAIAIERWKLHQRIALNIIHIIGSKVSYIILGFMVSTAFLSMWISNTATTVMMLPIAMAIIKQFEKEQQTNEVGNFGKALMLSIAYSASIGGISTLIGTPPNLVLAGILEKLYDIKLSFFDWMKFAFPIAVILIFFCWKYLTAVAFKLNKLKFPGGRVEIQEMKKKLGRISYEEKAVLIVFTLTAFAWIFRSLLETIIPALDDTIIAISAAIILFLIPTKKRDRSILTWDEAVKIPWGIIILFGGGMALAEGFTSTGLAVWIAEQLTRLENLPLFFLILILVAAVNFLTEVTSNLATTAMLLPILAPVALSFNIHPYFIMIGVTLAASCAFMLPVATPPNAIVFGSGYLKIPDMVKKGFLMNIISILVITFAIYFLLPFAFHIVADGFPEILK